MPGSLHTHLLYQENGRQSVAQLEAGVNCLQQVLKTSAVHAGRSNLENADADWLLLTHVVDRGWLASHPSVLSAPPCQSQEQRLLWCRNDHAANLPASVQQHPLLQQPCEHRLPQKSCACRQWCVLCSVGPLQAGPRTGKGSKSVLSSCAAHTCLCRVSQAFASKTESAYVALQLQWLLLDCPHGHRKQQQAYKQRNIVVVLLVRLGVLQSSIAKPHVMSLAYTWRACTRLQARIPLYLPSAQNRV